MFFFFFFNDTATTEIYTLSLHDALPICPWRDPAAVVVDDAVGSLAQRFGEHRHHVRAERGEAAAVRSGEHTSELQSRQYLVCRLLLEKKKKKEKYDKKT